MNDASGPGGIQPKVTQSLQSPNIPVKKSSPAQETPPLSPEDKTRLATIVQTFRDFISAQEQSAGNYDTMIKNCDQFPKDFGPPFPDETINNTISKLSDQASKLKGLATQCASDKTAIQGLEKQQQSFLKQQTGLVKQQTDLQNQLNALTSQSPRDQAAETDVNEKLTGVRTQLTGVTNELLEVNKELRVTRSDLITHGRDIDTCYDTMESLLSSLPSTTGLQTGA